MSEDEGRTWGTEMILRDDAGSWDIGYTRVIETEPGVLLTTYYINLRNDPVQVNGGVRHIACTIFRRERSIVARRTREKPGMNGNRNHHGLAGALRRTRRAFVAAGMAALVFATGAHAALKVTQEDVVVKTPDGSAEAVLFYPAAKGNGRRCCSGRTWSGCARSTATSRAGSPPRASSCSSPTASTAACAPATPSSILGYDHPADADEISREATDDGSSATRPPISPSSTRRSRPTGRRRRARSL